MPVARSLLTKRDGDKAGYYLPTTVETGANAPFTPTGTIGGFTSTAYRISLAAISANSIVNGTLNQPLTLPAITLSKNGTATIMLSYCLASYPLPNTILSMPFMSLSFAGTTTIPNNYATTSIFNLTSANIGATAMLYVALTATSPVAVAAQTISFNVWTLLLGQTTAT